MCQCSIFELLFLFQLYCLFSKQQLIEERFVIYSITAARLQTTMISTITKILTSTWRPASERKSLRCFIIDHHTIIAAFHERTASSEHYGYRSPSCWFSVWEKIWYIWGGLFRVRCTVSIIIIHPSIYGLSVGRFRHLGENLGMIPSGPTFPPLALIDLTPVQLWSNHSHHCCCYRKMKFFQNILWLRPLHVI